MLGGYNLLYSSVLFYTRNSIRICRNGVNSGGGGVSSSRGIFKRKSLSTKGKHQPHKYKIKIKWQEARSSLFVSAGWELFIGSEGFSNSAVTVKGFIKTYTGASQRKVT